jgi:hypothetical protein
LTLLKRTTESLNLHLAQSLFRLAGDRDPGSLLNEAELEREDPEVRFVYLYGLCLAWFILVGVSGIVLTGLSALAAFVGGHEWDAISLRATYFITAFCIAGGLDATWRVWLVQGARRRYRRNGRALDKQARRLVRVAWADDRTLLLQLAAGVASAVTLH